MFGQPQVIDKRASVTDSPFIGSYGGADRPCWLRRPAIGRSGGIADSRGSSASLFSLPLVDPLVIDERTGAGRFSAGLLAVMRGCLHLNEALNPWIAVVHVRPVPRRVIVVLSIDCTIWGAT